MVASKFTERGGYIFVKTSCNFCRTPASASPNPWVSIEPSSITSALKNLPEVSKQLTLFRLSTFQVVQYPRFIIAVSSTNIYSKQYVIL